MIAEGRFPFACANRRARCRPRVGDGLVRLDADGRVTYASPNALSAYRRLGLTGDLVGAHLGALTADSCGGDGPVDEAVAAALERLAPRERRGRGGGRGGAAARHPAAAGRPAQRGPRAGPRRHRAAAPRPRADDQGRHHPRDPPPGEEQPADRRRAAAAAGPPARLARGAARARGVRPPGRLDRARARDAVPRPRRGADFDEIADRIAGRWWATWRVAGRRR